MREGKIKLDANLGKTQVVHAGAAGEASKQPGFYCKACDIVVKDSANYLDHLNGRRRKHHNHFRSAFFRTHFNFFDRSTKGWRHLEA